MIHLIEEVQKNWATVGVIVTVIFHAGVTWNSAIAIRKLTEELKAKTDDHNERLTRIETAHGVHHPGEL